LAKFLDENGVFKMNLTGGTGRVVVARQWWHSSGGTAVVVYNTDNTAVA